MACAARGRGRKFALLLIWYSTAPSAQGFFAALIALERKRSEIA